MRKRRDSRLECGAGNAAENVTRVKDLFRDRFGVAVCAHLYRNRQGARHWPPAIRAQFDALRGPAGALLPWKEYFRGFACGLCEKANGMKTYSQSLGGMTGAAPKKIA